MSAKILIIDDDKDLVETTVDVLEANGYNVVYAYDGKTGLEKVRNESPKLVLLDVTLPGGINGYDVCLKIKDDSATSDIPVLMLTGKEIDEDVKRKFENKVSGYISKPYDIGLLIKTIGRFMI